MRMWCFLMNKAWVVYNVLTNYYYVHASKADAMIDMAMNARPTLKVKELSCVEDFEENFDTADLTEKEQCVLNKLCTRSELNGNDR